jgi:hypothetical protein
MVRRLELRYQRHRLRQEIILKIYNNVIKSKGVPWVHLAQDSKQKGVLVNTAMSHRIYKRQETC